jgi:putative ABC transport system permease protein
MQGLTFSIEGSPPWPPGEAPPLGLNFVYPGYFETMRIPILEGRGITAEDTATSRLVVVLSKAAADKFFPGQDPLGRRLEYGDPPQDGTHDAPFTWREVVGVVGDVESAGLGQGPFVTAYTPFSQTGEGTLFFAVRTKTPDAVLAAMPRLVQSLDPELAVSNLETMDARVEDSVGEARKLTLLLGGFAVLALLLATLGLFGLVSYTTAERTRELGIRLALGSPPAKVVALVVKGAMKLVLLGLGLGLLLSVGVAREVVATVPGATAFDPAALLPIPVLLAFSGVVACVWPALRAVRTPPSVALRYE